MKPILKKTVLCILFFVFSLNYAYADSLKTYLDKLDIPCTVIVNSLKSGDIFVYNKQRAARRFLPASTFKIPNSLIAINSRVIKDQYQTFKWDFINRGYVHWNRNHNLVSAYKYSCVWFFQRLAAKIGFKQYRNYLNRFNYGNKLTGNTRANFWLKGKLGISAVEQISFLRKLYQKKLGLNKRTYRIAKSIMLTRKTKNYSLYSKTGWAMSVSPQIGWYIGYIVKNNNVYFFAVNLRISEKKHARLRKKIIFHVLKKLKIII